MPVEEPPEALFSIDLAGVEPPARGERYGRGPITEWLLKDVGKRMGGIGGYQQYRFFRALQCIVDCGGCGDCGLPHSTLAQEETQFGHGEYCSGLGLGR